MTILPQVKCAEKAHHAKIHEQTWRSDSKATF